MRERGIYPQDCLRTVRSRRNRFGNTELACSPKYHGAKTAYWAVGRQLLPWDYFRIARQPSTWARDPHSYTMVPRGQCSNTARSSIRSRPIGASLRGPLAQVFCRGTRPITSPSTRRQSCFSSNDAAHHLRRRSERWDLGRFPGSRLTFACGWLQPITSSGLHRRLVCWRGLPPPPSRQEAACEGGGLGTQ